MVENCSVPSCCWGAYIGASMLGRAELADTRSGNDSRNETADSHKETTDSLSAARCCREEACCRMSGSVWRIVCLGDTWGLHGGATWLRLLGLVGTSRWL